MGFKGFDIPSAKLNTVANFNFDGKEYKLSHGSVVIAAITSCTNTSKLLFKYECNASCVNGLIFEKTEITEIFLYTLLYKSMYSRIRL